MRTIQATLDALTGIVSWSKAAGWDPVGLQIGDPHGPAARIGVCHDVTDRVLAAAEKDGVGLLLAYHPLLFEAARRFVAGSGTAGLAFEAARAGIAIANVHTGFDVAPGGTADSLADAFGLEDVSRFGPLWGVSDFKVITFVPAAAADAVVRAMAAAGAGQIGEYSACSFRSEGMGTFTAGVGSDPAVGSAGETTSTSEMRVEMVAPSASVDRVVTALVEAHPYEEPAYDVVQRRPEAGFVGRIGAWTGTAGELAALAEECLGGIVRRAGDAEHAVSRVAVVPGSGASLTAAAAAAGADAIVTGDVKHHDARTAVRSGLAVVDPGHAATERPGVTRLYAAVAAAVSDAVDLTAVDADPWAS